MSLFVPVSDSKTEQKGEGKSEERDKKRDGKSEGRTKEREWERATIQRQFIALNGIFRTRHRRQHFHSFDRIN